MTYTGSPAATFAVLATIDFVSSSSSQACLNLCIKPLHGFRAVGLEA